MQETEVMPVSTDKKQIVADYVHQLKELEVERLVLRQANEEIDRRSKTQYNEAVRKKNVAELEKEKEEAKWKKQLDEKNKAYPQASLGGKLYFFLSFWQYWMHSLSVHSEQRRAWLVCSQNRSGYIMTHSSHTTQTAKAARSREVV